MPHGHRPFSIPLLFVLAACGGADSDTAPADTDLPDNRAPVIVSLSIGPEAPLQSDAITATLDVDDPDGDDVSCAFDWTVDGTSVGTDVNPPATSYVRNNAIQLAVDCSDGTDVTSALSNTLTGGNHTPEVTRVDVLPDTLFTDSLAQADFDVLDIDEDVEGTALTWFVNGVGAGTGSQLDGASAFARGDEVQLKAMASDDALDSPEAASAVLVVANSLPTAPTLASSPAEPTSGAAVVCTVDTPATDADGDMLGYTFTWTLNGSPMTDTSTTTWPGDTANAASWSASDTLVCHAVANDGLADGEASSLNISGIAPPCAAANATISVDDDGRTYIICAEHEVWTDAEAACQTMGSAWHLVSIRSQDENDFVEDELLSAVGSGGGASAWIGFTDEAVEGTWVWSDGDASPFTHWGDPEPNGTALHNCAMFRAGTYEGTWNDIKCENTLNYVCTEAP